MRSSDIIANQSEVVEIRQLYDFHTNKSLGVKGPINVSETIQIQLYYFYTNKSLGVKVPINVSETIQIQLSYFHTNKSLGVKIGRAHV